MVVSLSSIVVQNRYSLIFVAFLFFLLLIVCAIPLVISNSIDISVWFNNHHTYILDKFLSYVTILCENLVYLSILFALYFIAKVKILDIKMDLFYTIFVSFCLSSAVVHLIKRVIVSNNFRPIVVLNDLYPGIHLNTVDGVKMLYNYSFPSGHSSVSMAFYGFLIYLICTEFKNKKYKYLLISVLSIVILFIGLSRIYLGVHYLSDVLAGFLFSIIYLIIFVYFYNKIIKM